MEAPLAARLVRADNFRLSLRPGRLGWTLSSPCPPRWVHLNLAKWTDRVATLHQPSGRFFVQPNPRYLRRVLSTSEVGYCPIFHGCPVRRERLRRLRPFLRSSTDLAAGAGRDLILAIALRLEALNLGPESEALWKHAAKDFDKLWAEVRLYSHRLRPWQKMVLDLLCSPVSSNL